MMIVIFVCSKLLLKKGFKRTWLVHLLVFFLSDMELFSMNNEILFDNDVELSLEQYGEYICSETYDRGISTST
jgi:hypothetical protein